MKVAWVLHCEYTKDFEFERIVLKKVNMMTFGFTFCLCADSRLGIDFPLPLGT